MERSGSSEDNLEPGAPSVERSGSSDRVTRSRNNSRERLSGPSPPMHPYSRPSTRPSQEQLGDARPESSSPKGSSSIEADGPPRLTGSARKLTVKSKPFWETREKPKSERGAGETSPPAITPSGLTPLLKDQAQIWPGAAVGRVSPLQLGSASPSAASPTASSPAAAAASQRKKHGTTAPVFGGVRICRNQGLYGRPARPERLIGRGQPELGARLMHAPPLREASVRRGPACQSPCLVVDAGVSVSVSKDFSKDFSAAAAAENGSSSSGSSSAKDAKDTKHRRTPSGSWPFGSRKAPQ
jgi:hypothetical protein